MQKRIVTNLLVVVVFLAFMAPYSLRADPNSLALINLTGGITLYDGTGIKVGQIELGTPTNHLDLVGNLATQILFTGATAGDNHATEVASVIASTGAVTLGVAPGAQIYSVGASTLADFISGHWLLATQLHVRVINMSAGVDSITGVVSSAGGTIYINPSRVFDADGNDTESRVIDHLVANQKVIFVNATGNTGLLGTNSIGNPDAAYNSITVGAVNHAGTAVADFSARGYLANGRSKPDIVAPGEGIAMAGYEVSTNYVRTWTEVHSNNVGGATIYPVGSSFPVSFNGPPQSPLTRVTTNEGTSYAAPHVSGVVARLLEVADGTANPLDDDPRVIKAVLLNAATKLPGWSHHKIGTDVIQPLDPAQGAGLLNAGRAYDQLIAGEREPTRIGTFVTTNQAPAVAWDLSTVGLSLTNVYYLEEQAFGEARLTLTWYRNVGGSDTGYSVLSLANLDLYLWSSPDNAFTNLTLVERSISSVDNVEHLYLTSLATNYYAFGVYYPGNLIGSDGGTMYALAWEFTVIPEPSTLLLVTLGLAVMHRLHRRRARDG